MKIAAYRRMPLAHARPPARAICCRCSMTASARRDIDGRHYSGADESIAVRSPMPQVAQTPPLHPSALAPLCPVWQHGSTGGKPMRWILLVVALAGFAIAFTTTSPGLMGLGLLIGCGGLLFLGFALAASRIAQNAQPETTMIVDPEIAALRAKANLAKAAANAPRTPTIGADRNQNERLDRP